MAHDRDSDWRSQLDSKYAGSAEFQEVLSQYTEERHVDPLTFFPTTDTINPNAALSKSYPAIRFPPVMKLPIPPPLVESDFIADSNIDLEAISRQSVRMDESIAGLQFLEAMLRTIYEKVKEIRESVIENGNYLYVLTKPLSGSDVSNIKSVVLENLILMRDDSVNLLEEIQLFSAEKMQEIVNMEYETASHAELITKLRQSLVGRGCKLQDAAATSLLTIDHLTEYAYSLVQYPSQPYCAADCISPSWEQINGFFKSKVHYSAASLQYLAYCSSRSHSVCDSVFSFLQEPGGYQFKLWVNESNRLKSEQFLDLMEFLALQHKRSLSMADSIAHNLRDLSFASCGISDYECALLAKHLNLFRNLVFLRLSHNKITFSGVASIATNIFEHGSKIRFLYLDHNRINREGAGILAQILPKMNALKVLDISHNPVHDQGGTALLRHCLNPCRKASTSFPKLNVAESQAYASLRRPARDSVSGSTIGENDIQEEEYELSIDEVVVDEDEDEDALTTRNYAAVRYPRQCYFEDYFVGGFQQAHNRVGSTVVLSESQQHMWVNYAHEEFDMDFNSEYGDDDDIDASSRSRSNSKDKPQAEQKDGFTWSQIVGSRRTYIQPTYPLIIRKILSLRLRLVAVNMFLKLRHRGVASLSNLNLSYCGLSPAVLPAVKHVLSDNHLITSLDISGHPHLLRASKHCQLMADAISLGGLFKLSIENTGLRDNGMLILSKSILQSPTLRELNVSNNYIGSTGANVVANLAKSFFVDSLSVQCAKARTAPLRFDGKEVESELGDDADVVAAAMETHMRMEDVGSDSILNDDDSSFVDNDMYDGEESDEEPEDMDIEEERKAVETTPSPAKKKSSILRSAVKLTTWRSKKSQ